MPFQPKLSERVHRVKPSPTLALNAKAKQMKADGIDVLNFGVGEPDFDTPDPVKEAACRALAEGFTKYTAVEGIPELRKAIAAKLERDNGLSYRPEEILVSNGGKQSFYNWACACLDEGDEVIIPAPCWVSYPDMVALADGTPVIVHTLESNGYRLTPAELEAALTERTRAVVINSPSNPTGMGYSADRLRALGRVLEKRPDVTILSDEIYEKIVYRDFRHVSIASLSPQLKAQTLVLNGMSKAYAMTGWRIGYAAGDRRVIEAMATVQGQSTSNANAIAQRASVAALTMDQGIVEQMREAFDRRRERVVSRLNAIPGVRCPDPDGAFYVFPNLSRYFTHRHNGRPIKDSEGLASYLLEEAKVAVVAGWGFDGPECVRLSYAAALDLIEKGLDRIEAALAGLEKP